jgi:hypothetical protein
VTTNLDIGQLPVCRQTAPYSPELEPDIVLIEPQPRHRTPSAWMILCTLGGSIALHSMAAFHCNEWQHNAALGGRIDSIQQIGLISEIGQDKTSIM